jgi:uncharacterized membrane protein YagU involved in acid resistance
VVRASIGLVGAKRFEAWRALMVRIGENRNVSAMSIAFAGLMSGAVTAVLIVIATSLNMTELNWLMFLGTFTGLTVNSYALFVGVLIHLFMSVLFAFAYAPLFRRYDRSGFGQGAIIGFAQWAILGTIVGAVQSLHWLIPEEFVGAGYLWTENGFGTFSIYFGLQIIFGGIVGVAYHRIAVREEEQLLTPAF